MKRLAVVIVAFLVIASCSNIDKSPKQIDNQDIKIAFGSCLHQDKPVPMLGIAARQDPDVFVFLGDNIYGDSRIMDTLTAKYNRLLNKPEFHVHSRIKN